MRKRYLLTMLSTFPMLLVFNFVYFSSYRSWEILAFLAGLQLVLFGLVNALGAYALYRPVHAALSATGDPQRGRTRILRLTLYSTVWVLCIGVAYVAITMLPLYLDPALFGQSPVFAVERIPQWYILAAVPPAAFVFAIIPAFITYFLITDFSLDLKAATFQSFAQPYPAGRRRIGIVLLAVFFVLGFLPVALVILELIIAQDTDYAKFTDMDPLQTVLIDRIVILIGTLYAIVLITRSFTKPIGSLLSEMNRVRAGDYTARAALIPEDEIGALARQFNEMVKGLNEREFMRATFGRYLTKDVAARILEGGIDLEGEIRTCTILVTDIADYASISETLAPAEIVALLNEYFSAVVGAIHEHGGLVNKFIGDSVFAIFNVPVDDPAHAERAVQAALAIQTITRERPFGQGRVLHTRVGVNTGVVVAGNIGSADRMEYTVIGDDVNVAARLEQLNKEYGTSILVGENTYDRTHTQFAYRQLGEAQLKGKEKALRIYTVAT